LVDEFCLANSLLIFTIFISKNCCFNQFCVIIRDWSNSEKAINLLAKSPRDARIAILVLGFKLAAETAMGIEECLIISLFATAMSMKKLRGCNSDGFWRDGNDDHDLWSAIFHCRCRSRSPL